MGNVLLVDESRKVDPAEAYQRWLEQNPGLTGMQILAQNKLFKSSSYKFNGRYIILKTFFKRDPSPVTQELKIFETFQRKVEREKTVHIVPMKIIPLSVPTQSFIVGYRQKMSKTLEQVLHSKPNTTEIKKRWYIFQMIHAVYTVHQTFNFYHGHIRTSNFVESTCGFLSLTDFACYKPLFMFEDSEEGLPEFRLFYSSSVDNCTIAPEKITYSSELMSKLKSIQRNPAKVFSSFHHEDWVNPVKSESMMNLDQSVFQSMHESSFQSNENQKHRQVSLEASRSQLEAFEQINKLKQMDIFSLGCSILEVLRDGKPLLTFEDLLKLKKGEITLDKAIEEGCKKLKQEEKEEQILKNLLYGMLSVNPEKRPTIQEVYEKYQKTIDMNIYSLVWHCLSAFSTTSFHQPDMRIALLYSIMKFIENEERNRNLDFHIQQPKALSSFEALKIFKNLIKNKIIFVMENIPEGSYLQRIINSTDRQSQIDSEEELIANDEVDQRREFFVPLKHKRTSLSKTSTTVNIMKGKQLCPPEWDRQMNGLIEAKYKGTRLTPGQLQRNNFQDLLDEFKKSQYIRESRIHQKAEYYNPLSLIIRVIFSCIRGCKYISSKLIAIELLMTVARQSNDGIKLRRLVPYLMFLIDDSDSVVCRYAFNTLIDLFYLFIDPFENEEDTNYYDMFIEMLINCIKTSRLRITLFRRMKSIYEICQWLQVHIRKIRKLKEEPPVNFNKVLDIVKTYFGSYRTLQIKQLMSNIHPKIWPNMFEYFVSFLNMDKVLGLEKSIEIAGINDIEAHKKMIDVIDNCVESGLDENGLSLFYAIKYFSSRKIFTLPLVKKIAPMAIHPHLWVRDEAKEFIRQCLKENPPTRVFFLLREAFEPPFPLQPQDIDNQILLPQSLDVEEVDFSKKIIKPLRRIGLTQKLFIEYLEKLKVTKSQTHKESNLQEWHKLAKSIMQFKIEPIDFSAYIKKSIVNLFEQLLAYFRSNFLYYVGNSKSPYNPMLKQEEKKILYSELNEILKQLSKFSLDDGTISHEKKDFFLSLITIVSKDHIYIDTTFEKLLTFFLREEKIDKIQISESLHLIMEVLYKFDQFQIKPTLKLGEYTMKSNQIQKIKPRGHLLTEIYEHKDVITCLENIADKFLISGSYDGTLRVFNTKKMEMNVTIDSEAVYEIGYEQQEKSKIHSIAAFENTYTIVAGTSKGQIRVFQIERMRGKGLEMNRSSRSADNSTELLKYSVGGEISKLITFKNGNRNECFSFITAEGILGVQDIRSRTKTMTCNIGKERGIPRCLAFSPLGPSILIGTLDGYVLTYDIRCNIISNVKQLIVDQNPASITGIYQSPYSCQGRPLFAYTYPSKHYQFAYFDIYNDSQQFKPEKFVTSTDREEVISMPTMLNKTKEENFKLCSNSLTQKIYYKQLDDFNKNFNLLEHLNHPITSKEEKIREIWMNRCKHRYNQIYSIFNKKSLPFLYHLPCGIFTHLNPILGGGESRGKKNFTILTDRIDNKDISDLERVTSCKPAGSSIHTFPEEEGSDYLTSCSIFSNMVAVGSEDSIIRIYK